MKYKLLGNTGLKVSELCLGTMTFGGKGWAKMVGSLDQQAVDKIMRRSIDAGINFIDTANVYSEGLAEELTGKSIRNLGLKRDDLVVATKVRGQMGEGPNDSGLTRKHILTQVDASLKRLATDYIDLYQIHSFDPLTPLAGDAVDPRRSGEKRQGSLHRRQQRRGWRLMKALDFSNYTRVEAFASLQAYYTIAGRDLEREMIPLLKDQRLGLLVWSPLAGGLLSGKYRRGEEKGDTGRRSGFDFPPVDKERAFNIIDVLRPMAESRKASVARLALAGCCSRK
ncbi:aldo/keto reductase [Puia sp. P3]|uniref:aldo/keto reductase n=1 Tax=Puia sp. P3 TaxID=3423952 RepID=UPI003D67A724